MTTPEKPIPCKLVLGEGVLEHPVVIEGVEYINHYYRFQNPHKREKEWNVDRYSRKSIIYSKVFTRLILLHSIFSKAHIQPKYIELPLLVEIIRRIFPETLRSNRAVYGYALVLLRFSEYPI